MPLPFFLRPKGCRRVDFYRFQLSPQNKGHNRTGLRPGTGNSSPPTASSFGHFDGRQLAFRWPGWTRLVAGLAGSNSLFAGHAVLHFFGYPHGYWMGIWLSEDSRWRPYRDEYTRSLQNSEVNRRRARIVLRWGTAREVLRVLPALLPFSPVSTGLPLLRRPVSTVAILAQGTYSWLATRSPFFRRVLHRCKCHWSSWRVGF